MNKLLFISFILLTALLSACIDPYYPEIDKYENTLAVDGLITSDSGPYFVRLQYAATIYTPEINPIENASVYITDDLGNIEYFQETDPGVYSNSSTDFKGTVGRSYLLTISLSENKIYQSGWEKLSAPVGIDSVYAELENYVDPSLPYTLSGYQFYVDTKEVISDTTFLIWRLESTYKYNSAYKCWDIFAGKILPFPKSDSLFTCWKTEMVPKIIVGSTKSSSKKQLLRYPLHYVSGEGRELSVRYSVFVNQYVVSETVYDYWKSVRDQNEIQGSLYTQQPYQIRGNMININNPDEPVIGCFAAAGVAKRRVYYNRPEIEFNYDICVIHDADYEDMRNIWGSRPWEWPIYLSRDANHHLFNPQQWCIDCRQKGGKLERPDFWSDY